MTQFRLTVRRLEAITEALGYRLAGDLDDSDLSADDYELALAWASERLQARREHDAGVAHLFKSMSS